MKKPVFTLLLLSIAFYSRSQFPVSADSVYTFMKYNSVFRNTVNWEKTDKEFATALRTARSLKDTLNCFVLVLKALNDVHSHIIFNNTYYGHYNPLDAAAYARVKPLMEKAAAVEGRIYCTTIHNRYGYVQLPSIAAYNTEQINSYGQQLYDSICQYDPEKIKGFIIDLRLNTGGNMYPMLGGLHSLLGNGVIGYETDLTGTVVRTWEIKDNNFVIGGYAATNLQLKCKTDYSQIPVVVLTGPVTSSSGAITAIAFRNRPHTIFVGEPTADGYTTSNGYFQFAPNLAMNFATTFVADRNKTIYRSTVIPDVIVEEGDNFDELLKDKKIIIALDWFKRNKYD